MLNKITNRAYKASTDWFKHFYSPWESVDYKVESQNGQLRLTLNLIWASLGAVIIAGQETITKHENWTRPSEAIIKWNLSNLPASSGQLNPSMSKILTKPLGSRIMIRIMWLGTLTANLLWFAISISQNCHRVAGTVWWGRHIFKKNWRPGALETTMHRHTYTPLMHLCVTYIALYEF